MVNSTFDWKSEQDRFMTLAFHRAERAAYRAFKAWHSCKREDAIAEMVGKVWATWVYNLEKGKDPLKLLGPNIRFAILWVRYDRRIAGRTGMPDVYDYRSGYKQQHLSEQGQASPNDRSDPGNQWIDWTTPSREADPAELAAALEVSGLCLNDLRESA